MLCIVGATIAAGVLTVLAEKQYSATAALLLRTSADDPQRAIDTNLQLLSLPEIASRTAEAVPGMSTKGVEDAVETKQQGESDIILVEATTSDPDRAAELANTFASEFIASRGGASAESPQTGQLELVDRATREPDQVSPKPVRNVVFGALIGLVIGLGLALLREQLDRRVNRQDDLAETAGLPLLASIPKRESFDREHLGRRLLSPAEIEVFRLLRANLRYFRAEQDLKSVLVASAEPGEGKTLLSLGLALAAVTSGERVLLIEADLRDPSVRDLLGLPAGGGLSEALSADAAGSLADAVTQVKAADFADGVGDLTIDVVHAGAIPPNPTALIESQRMKDLLAEAESAYDFVVIDTPPLLVVSDAIPLISITSGVLAVSGLGVSERSSVAEMTGQLERLGAPILGLVANFAEDTGRSYDGYGYGRPPEIQRGSQAPSR